MRFIFLILLFNSANCFSQTKDSTYTIIPIYYSSFYKSIEPVDYLYSENAEYSEIKGPYNSLTKSYKIYSRHQKYQLRNKQILSIDFFQDTIILYREFVKDSKNEFDSLITFGELKLDLSIAPTTIQELPGSDNYGDDSLIYESFYLVVPNGIWSIYKDEKTFQNGVFTYGIKTGTWFNYYSEFYGRNFKPFQSSLEYDNGVLLSEKINDLSKSEVEITNLIVGEWFNLGLDGWDYTKCRDSKCALFFTRDSSVLTRVPYNIIDYLNLKKDNSYLSKESYLCGNGIKEKDPNEKTNWEVIKENETYFLKLVGAKFDGRKFKIEYLTENELILSF